LRQAERETVREIQRHAWPARAGDRAAAPLNTHERDGRRRIGDAAGRAKRAGMAV